MMTKYPEMLIKSLVWILLLLPFAFFSCRGREKIPGPIDGPVIELQDEEYEEEDEAQGAEAEPGSAPVQISRQTQTAGRSFERGGSALSGIGGRVSSSVLDPVNYENPDLDILRHMGVDQHIISYLAGEQFYKEGNFERALIEHSNEYYHYADFIEALISRGNIFLRRGEHSRAIDDFTRAIRIDAYRPELYNYRGYARAELAAASRNQHREIYFAIEDFSRALVLNSNYTDALVNRSRALFEIGEYDRVIEDCGRIISLEPRNASAWNRRGNAWYNKGDLNRALADYNQALALNPFLASAAGSREVVQRELNARSRQAGEQPIE